MSGSPLPAHSICCDLIVNKVKLESIQSESLFSIVLNIWIGKVPPNRECKVQQFSGNVNLYVENELNEIKILESLSDD